LEGDHRLQKLIAIGFGCPKHLPDDGLKNGMCPLMGSLRVKTSISFLVKNECLKFNLFFT
jgi:hypothetical protein